MKKQKTPLYQVTYKQIENYIEQGYKKGRYDAIKEATELSMAVPMMILRDEFGFGGKRLVKFYEAFIDLYDSIDKKYLDLKDIIKTIKEETGIEIVKK